MIPQESDPFRSPLSQAAQETTDEQHDDRPERRDAKRPQVEIAGGNVTPPQGTSDQAANERAEDAEYDRDDAARRVTTWHQEFCE